jgi:hypothetical protein
MTIKLTCVLLLACIALACVTRVTAAYTADGVDDDETTPTGDDGIVSMDQMIKNIAKRAKENMQRLMDSETNELSAESLQEELDAVPGEQHRSAQSVINKINAWKAQHPIPSN